jgi:hypothetical protein
MEINSDLNDKSNTKTTTFNEGLNFQAKQKKYEHELLKENQKKFYNKIEYKTNLLNIDSQFRNKTPKNIYTTNNTILPNNPVIVTRNSNIVSINYPNHSFNIGDSIIIQNVSSNYKILTNCVYFFDHLSFMIVKYDNHNIALDYSNFYDLYQIQIE